MANSIDRVKQDIRKRLDELEAERDQLLRAFAALGGGAPAKKRGRPPGSGSATAALCLGGGNSVAMAIER